MVLSCFGVGVSLTFHLTCVHNMFRSVWVAEWPPFWEMVAHSVEHRFSLILVISRFGFEGWISVLIAAVPGLCILFDYQILKQSESQSNS